MGEDLGARIKQARMRRGMTQGALGEAIGAGRTTVSRIESGERSVRTLELADMTDALDVSMRDLIGHRELSEPLRIARLLRDGS